MVLISNEGRLQPALFLDRLVTKLWLAEADVAGMSNAEGTY